MQRRRVLELRQEPRIEACPSARSARRFLDPGDFALGVGARANSAGALPPPRARGRERRQARAGVPKRAISWR
jgi:hypothetical protein